MLGLALGSLLGACYPGWSGCYWQKCCVCIH